MDEQNHSNQLVAKLTKEAASSRIKAKEFRNQLEKERSIVQDLQKELEQLKVQLNEASKPNNELLQYKQELEQLKHHSAFTKVAKSLGIAEDRIDAAWKLSDYKIDGDVNDDVITKILSQTLEKNVFLKSEPSLQPGLGSAKGLPVDSTKKLVRRRDFNDPRWLFNNSWIGEAIKKEEVEFTDD